MPQATYGVTLAVGGVSIQKTSVKTGDHSNTYEILLPAAYSVTAWVKTDDNTASGNLPAGHGQTNGKFDVTFGALSDVWKFDQDKDNRVPGAEEIAARLPLIDYRAIAIDRRSPDSVPNTPLRPRRSRSRDRGSASGTARSRRRNRRRRPCRRSGRSGGDDCRRRDLRSVPATPRAECGARALPSPAGSTRRTPLAAKSPRSQS